MSNLFNIKKLLLEKTRNELILKSKRSDNYKDQSKGKNRFERRTKSRVATSVRQYNKIDMDTFFKKDILNVGIEVKGETKDYVVTMQFNGVLNELSRDVKANNGKLEFKNITRAMSRVYNSDNLKLHCSCPDWKYRQAYFATKGGYATIPELRPSKKTNPNDTKGGGCKHSMLVMSNLDWMMKVSSVINNYIKYCREHMQNNYATYIFPRIYGVSYKQAVQLSLFDDGLLPSDQETLTKIATTNLKDKDSRGKWIKNNTYAFKGSKNNRDEEEPDSNTMPLGVGTTRGGKKVFTYQKDNDRDSLGRFIKGNTASKRKAVNNSAKFGSETNKQIVPDDNK